MHADLREWPYYLLAAILLVCFALTFGCASQFGPMGMSPEQLAAWGKIKDQQAGCVKGVYAGVTVLNTWWNVDRGVQQGTVTIKDDCSIVYSAPAAP